jgi:hypothetical protein
MWKTLRKFAEVCGARAWNRRDICLLLLAFLLNYFCLLVTHTTFQILINFLPTSFNCKDVSMKTRFSLLLAFVAGVASVVVGTTALLSGFAGLTSQSLYAQTFTATASGAWTVGGTWTPSTMPPAVGAFPGASPGNNGTAILAAAGAITMTGAAPADPVSGVQINAPGPANFSMTGTLRVSGGLTMSASTVLNITSGALEISGPLTLPAGAVINVNAGASLTVNGTIVGTGVINSAAATSTLSLGPTFNAGLIQGANFGTLQGQINTGGALTLSSGNLVLGANASLNLVGALTANNGTSISFANTAANALVGSGTLQGQSALATVDFLAGFNMNIIPAANIANPFNGRMIVRGAAMTYNGPMTIGATGALNIAAGTLAPVAAANTLILNNTAAGSFTGPGTLPGIMGGSLTLGAGFNGGILPGTMFPGAGPLGTVTTSSALSLSSNLTLPMNSVLTLGGLLTIGNGVNLNVTNTAAGAITGMSLQAANAPNGILTLAAGANGGQVPSASIASPYAGNIVTVGAFGLPSSLTMGTTGVLNLGGNLTLAGTANLTLNMTAVDATSMPGTGLVVPAAGTSITIGSGAFGTILPKAKLGTPAGTIPAGTLVLQGSSQLATGAPTPFVIAAPASLVLNGQLTIPSATALDLLNTGATTLIGTGAIQAQDNTASLNLGAGFNAGILPAERIASPYNGVLTANSALTMTAAAAGYNLVMGNTSRLNLATGNLTVQTPASLTLNMTAAAATALPGANQIIGNGTVALGTSALAGVFPVTRIVSPAMSGTIGVGGNITFGTNYNVQNPTRLRLDGLVTVQTGISLGLLNTTAGALFGTGTLQGQSATASVGLANGFNGGQIPGAQFANPFNGTLQTVGAMTLPSPNTLNIGTTGILNLSGATAPPGNLTVSPGALLTISSTANPAIVGMGAVLGAAGASVAFDVNANGNLVNMSKFATAGPPADSYRGTLTLPAGIGFSCPIATPFAGTLNLLGAITVAASCNLQLTNTSANALIGVGTLQGVDNTASITLGASYNASQVPGARFAVPFNGRLINSGATALASNLTMGTGSILDVGSTFTINNGTQLTMNGTTTSALLGAGTVQGQSAAASLLMGPNFYAGTVPVANLSSPFNGRLINSSPMTLGQSFVIGAAGGLQVNAALTIAAMATLNIDAAGANTVAGSGPITAAASSSRVIFGMGANAGILPAPMFAGFIGNLAIISPMTLSNTLNMAPSSALNLSGAGLLTLGSNNLITGRVQGASPAAYIITNSTGFVTLNGTTNPYVFHIGPSANNYTPITVNNMGAADTFTARVSATFTNQPTLYTDRVNLEWTLSQGSAMGTKNVTVTPQWNAGNEVGMFNRALAQTGFWNGTAYNLSATGPATPAGVGFTRTTTVTIALNNTVFIATSIPPPPPPPAIPPPAITMLTPSTVVAGVDPLPLRIDGTNFRPGARVEVLYFPGVVLRLSTTAVFATQISTTIPGIARSGNRTLTVRVTNSDGTVGTSQITVTPAAAPTITSLAPSSTSATGQSYFATINGTNFFPSFSFARIEDPVRGRVENLRMIGQTTATQAVVEIPARFNSTTAANIITFFNPDGQSTSAVLRVQGGILRPFVTSVSPSSTTANVTSLTITLSGTNFFQALTVRFSGIPLVPTFSNSTQIVFTVPRELLTLPGFPRIEVENDDGLTSGAVFVIAPAVAPGPRPTITAVTPSVTTASFRAFAVVLTGQNFSPMGVLSSTFPGVQINYVDNTRLVALVPAFAAEGVFSIGITNPDGQATSATVVVGAALPGPIVNNATLNVTTATTRGFTVGVTGMNFSNGATAVLVDSTGRVLGNLTVNPISSTSLGILIPGDLNTAMQRGSNRIVIINSDGQTVTAPFTIISSVLVSRPLPGVKAFPNPVTDELVINATLDRSMPLRVTVMNGLGQTVMSFTENVRAGAFRTSLNFATLPAGSYMLEVTDGERRYVEKIVKN